MVCAQQKRRSHFGGDSRQKNAQLTDPLHNYHIPGTRSLHNRPLPRREEGKHLAAQVLAKEKQKSLEVDLLPMPEAPECKMEDSSNAISRFPAI